MTRPPGATGPDTPRISVAPSSASMSRSSEPALRNRKFASTSAKLTQHPGRRVIIDASREADFNRARAPGRDLHGRGRDVTDSGGRGVQAWRRRSGVVVPCKDEVATIERCLLALRAQDPPPARVVVVDNGSTDGSPRGRAPARGRGPPHPAASRSARCATAGPAPWARSTSSRSSTPTARSRRAGSPRARRAREHADLAGWRSDAPPDATWVAGRWAAVEARQQHGQSLRLEPAPRDPGHASSRSSGASTRRCPPARTSTCRAASSSPAAGSPSCPAWRPSTTASRARSGASCAASGGTPARPAGSPACPARAAGSSSSARRGPPSARVAAARTAADRRRRPGRHLAARHRGRRPGAGSSAAGRRARRSRTASCSALWTGVRVARLPRELVAGRRRSERGSRDAVTLPPFELVVVSYKSRAPDRGPARRRCRTTCPSCVVDNAGGVDGARGDRQVAAGRPRTSTAAARASRTPPTPAR